MELCTIGAFRALSRIRLPQKGFRHANKLCFHCSAAHRRPDGSSQTVSASPAMSGKAEKVSKAMKLYLTKTSEYKEKISAEVEEYELGKRHLANIMGMDPETFTKQDVHQSIKYLLPSGLTDKKARPMLKHPSELYPKMLEAQFGMDGRPHHFLFYTGKSRLYQLIHELGHKLDVLDEELFRRNKRRRVIKERKKIDLSGTVWITQETLQKMTDSSTDRFDYNRFIVLMNCLAEHELAYLEEDLIRKYRKKLHVQTVENIPEVQTDEEGRKFLTAIGKRKSAKAFVRVFFPGTGEVSINDQSLGYFKNSSEREQLLFPLQLTDRIGRVDIAASVEGGGPMGQAGAIRLAISLALRPFVSKQNLQNMRLAGLLTKDPRIREKKKTGQPGARKKFTWKRR